jgi:hypothetical protein
MELVIVLTLIQDTHSLGILMLLSADILVLKLINYEGIETAISFKLFHHSIFAALCISKPLGNGPMSQLVIPSQTGHNALST